MKRLLGVALLVVLGACDSPEAARGRGGGPGADTGNRNEVVLMHEGSRPYYGTARLIATQPGPVAPANHAHELSLP